MVILERTSVIVTPAWRARKNGMKDRPQRGGSGGRRQIGTGIKPLMSLQSLRPLSVVTTLPASEIDWMPSWVIVQEI